MLLLVQEFSTKFTISMATSIFILFFNYCSIGKNEKNATNRKLNWINSATPRSGFCVLNFLSIFSNYVSLTREIDTHKKDLQF